MVQNPLLVNSLENEKGFLSIIIPNKVLEAVLCPNFAKKTFFWVNFGSQFPIEIRKRPKSFTILKRIHLRSFLEYSWVSWTHPFFQSGAPISLVSRKNHNFVITEHKLGTYGVALFTKSQRTFILMIQDYQNQSQAHPFFCMGRRSLQNPDFQLLRYDRKRRNYGHF